MKDKTCRVGSYVSVEADETHFGKVVELRGGRALIQWKGWPVPSWIDELDLLQRDGAPWDRIAEHSHG